MNQEAEQLAAVIDEIRRRVRARHPDGVVLGDIPLTDLMPLVRARDAAEAKVAAIGSVNPRPAGLKNSIIQFVKRQIARALDWHVREQIEFNRAVLICVQTALEALNENNRTFRELSHETSRTFKALSNENNRAFVELSNETSRAFNELAGESSRQFEEFANGTNRRFEELASENGRAFREFAGQNGSTLREFVSETNRKLGEFAGENQRAFQEFADQNGSTLKEFVGETNRKFEELAGENERAFQEFADQNGSTLKEFVSESNRKFEELAGGNGRKFEEFTNEFQEFTSENGRALKELANEANRSQAEIAVRMEGLDQTASGLRVEAQDLRAEAQELRDIRTHWYGWHEAWERKLAANEIHFLRGIADLQAAFQHRVTLMDQNYREKLDAQHADFHAELARYSEDVQKRLWVELAKVRTEYEALIHNELRVVRQKLSFTRAVSEAAETVSAAPASAGLAAIDWLRFADRFRGSEESVKQRQQLYAERFTGKSKVLDLGCGRGEMLEVLREAGIPARGVDLHEESLALCAAKGLEVEKADLFQYLDSLPDSSLGGVICAQVVEHLPPERLPDLVRLIQAKLRRKALVAIETPNPECLAIFATHFFLDPTHQRPVPAPLLTFYLEEAGFGAIEIVRLSPAVDSMPSLARLPKGVREDFFGALDYTAFARKL